MKAPADAVEWVGSILERLADSRCLSECARRAVREGLRRQKREAA